ncbi:YebC/PmpR family DNA-binding transcriptional regulator [Candidatus Bipolaricaulota bacterium]|nr:YebC/PmpR family DNA-binding transcriptional regulator [Candidatus Bipolaricaulota bacterium]
MAGHSKWANTKYRKERQDKKRSSAFGKLIKEITIQARNGDPNPEHNPGLAQALERAKAANLPKDNIDRALKRAAGELEGMAYEEITYEGYANDGVAVLIRSVTDNKNRAAADIRHIFSKNGGSMASVGSVSWLFDRKGMVLISELPDGIDHDDLEFALIEAGAEEISNQDGMIEATCAPADLPALIKVVKDRGITPDRAEATMIPKSTVHVEGAAAEKVLKIVNLLDEHEDVQEVFANFDIDDEFFEKLEAEGES